MPVIEPDPPPGAGEAVLAALQQFGDVPESALHALAGTRPNELVPTEPHPVFHARLSDLTAADGLGSLRPSGWRFLLRQGGEVVASAETLQDQDGNDRFSHFNSGPFVAATVAAIATAQALPQTRDASYERRLLHVPALHTLALWLHDESGKDVFVALDPAPGGIETNRAYDADEFLRILADRAAQIPDLAPEDTRGG
jgi:hypothetical protein